MKKFFYLAIAVMTALCTTACGSDDDNNSGGNNSSNKSIPAPATASNAVSYQIPTGTASATTDVRGKDGETIHASLTRIDITESSKAVIEVTSSNISGKKQLKYVTFDAEKNGDTYVIKNGVERVGTVTTSSATRTEETVNILFSLKFKIKSLSSDDLVFESTDPVLAKAVVEIISPSTETVSISRTWKVDRMKLTLVFDDKTKTDASTSVTGGNLQQFIELADDNGVSLSESDRKALNKTIAGVTFQKDGLFTIAYTDGGETDAATWSWIPSTSSLRIKLKDGDMGNKFIADNSTIEIQYPGNNDLIIIFTTRLNDDACDASLIVNLSY